MSSGTLGLTAISNAPYLSDGFTHASTRLIIAAPAYTACNADTAVYKDAVTASTDARTLHKSIA